MNTSYTPYQISILGCGWLGLPLANHLLAKGYAIKGSTTTKDKVNELQASGIKAFQIKLSETGIEGPIAPFLEQSELLILNVPPGLRKVQKDHVQEVLQLLPLIKKTSIKKVLFLSSITVFEDGPDIPRIDHRSPPNGKSDAAVQLRAIEEHLCSEKAIETTVLRLAGLFDEQRHPGFVLSGRSGLSNGQAPINLIHKKDVIHCMTHILELNCWGERLNLSYPFHPPKNEYYRNFCLKRSLKPPEYDTNEISKGKLIDSHKTEQLLQLKLTHQP
jgi:nucleoside-diphosphate-sugar epimerase